MSKRPSRFIGRRDAVLSALTDDWQSASAIACQMVFPPDALARVLENRAKSWRTHVGTISSVKSFIVSQSIGPLVKQGLVEKRMIGLNKNEYRLSQRADNK
jgi:hypothetical protein